MLRHKCSNCGKTFIVQPTQIVERKGLCVSCRDERFKPGQSLKEAK